LLLVQSSPGVVRAEARIGRSPDGVTIARIRIKRGPEAVELLAHELEHVLERVDGINLLWKLRRPGSGISLSGGAFETRRAIDAGRRVAEEVRAATRAGAERVAEP
jgi:hypothetical protein